MVEVANSGSSEVIDCREDDGAFRDALGANNRKLFWEEICAELIDNALEHSADVCVVLLEWTTRKKQHYFRCVDNGLGSNDIRAFFKPGKTLGTGKAAGNSTFGMGLFVCECCISTPVQEDDKSRLSSLRVATYNGMGHLLVGERMIDKSSAVKVTNHEFNDESASRFQINDHGTNVTFNRMSKRIPKGDEYSRIANNLGKTYATLIDSGILRINLVKDGVTTAVVADRGPDVSNLQFKIVEIAGHNFEIEWGVTTDICRDNGCRLIYGGKFFSTTDAACGKYNIGRFYSSIRIPRSIGRSSMDIMKRCVDHPVMDELYSQCYELFMPDLERSDALCRHSEYEALNSGISELLSIAIKPDSNATNDPDEVDPLTREYFGRDITREGAQSTGKGTKHRRNRRVKGVPDACSVLWSRIGEDKGLAIYQHESNRITFNEDVPMMLKLREEKHKMLLASIAAGAIAKDIEGSSRQAAFGFSDNDFFWIYRVMMERVTASCEI